MGSEQDRLARLRELGQSVWLDSISREMIASGALAGRVAAGVGGVTTNPSIFEKAVAAGTAYDSDIDRLARSGHDAAAILEHLMIADVQAACDLLRPVYERSDGGDGFVSIEVSPALANDADGTIAAARHLWENVDRRNVMIKIPGTREGLPAIRRSITDGINVNVTLMFSMRHYEAVVDAFMSGLEDRLAAGRSPGGIASVASFFVSRVDSIVDKTVDRRLAGDQPSDRREALLSLKGRMAVANSRLVWWRSGELFAQERWRRLADDGAREQRVLWASTSTKNPDYDDLLYVDTLIGARTVNTLPEATLDVYLDHGRTVVTVDDDPDGARWLFRLAGELGIDMNELTEQLQVEGVGAFAASYDSLLAMIDEKARRLSGA